MYMPLNEIKCDSLDHLPDVVQKILPLLSHPLILMVGDLGAGKTTFTKALLKQLGSEDEGASPSYSLINVYAGPQGPIYHLDLYRLETAEEAFDLGLEDYLYGGQTCIVEWPQLVMEHIDPPYHLLKIELREGEQRVFILEEIVSEGNAKD